MNKTRHISWLVTLLFLVVMSCKSTATLTSGEANLTLSKKDVLKAHQKSTPDFKTMQAKVRVVYTEGTKSQTHTVNLRMEADKTIWINSALNLIRVMITPEKVQFYNKLDNTYFDGDFSYLSDLLGTELDYHKVQNLLLGNAIFNLDKNNYNMSIYEDAYLFQPKEQIALFELFYIVNASHFKMNSQQLQQPRESRFLQVDYLNYQIIDKQSLPEQLKIIALEGDDETIIELEIKSVSLNEEVRFPFKIPSGFDKIDLK
ncbi:DUF4292 domain-containing protein [Bizionia sp. M204]|uniref:DUF4292 domain-containing protein n=1 Tax=Bizionia sp. M204 TaxID=2675331 RepID=UPI0020BF458B|nr:DUF4292 domain-containing protein [Bizionia sp. M204]